MCSGDGACSPGGIGRSRGLPSASPALTRARVVHRCRMPTPSHPHERVGHGEAHCRATTSGCNSAAPAAVGVRDWVVVQEPALVGEDDGLDAVAKAELGEDVRDVRLDGRLADEELLTDLGIR